MSQENLWTAAEISKLQKLIAAGKSPVEIYREMGGRSYSACNHKIAAIRAGKIKTGVEPNLPELIFNRLKKESVKILALAHEFQLTTRQIENVIFDLSKSKNITISNGIAAIVKPAFGRINIDVFGIEWQKYGVLGDTHLACKEERLDALHAVYDIYAQEGIKHVFHAGNIVDGYVQRINGASVIVSTPDGQAQYVIDNYPQRDGIVTHFITGDDHEGWWIKDGFNWGAYLEMMAKKQGREDLHYIGHVEADVDLVTKGGKAIMKVQHPGGGSSYARSYAGQKQVEAFQGGEKPQILLQGHYHVNNYMFDRNVHVIGLPGFQDQTVFGRKLKLRFDVGGGILHFKQNPDDGSISRLKYEIIPFFDRKYYQAYLRSDKKLVSGKLVMNDAK